MSAEALATYAEVRSKESRVKDLVLEHLPLVTRVVNRLPRALVSAFSREDLISAGTLGLVQAAHRFDEAKGVKFGTFAYHRVRGAVIDHLRENDRLGKSARTQLADLRKARGEFRGENGRAPTLEELARQAQIPQQDVLRCLSNEKWDCVISLDSPRGGAEEDGNVLAALLADTAQAPPEKLEWKERVEQLGKAIQQLPERQRHIIMMYYYQGLYMAEMGQVLNISESRVSQLHTRAVNSLGRTLAAAG